MNRRTKAFLLAPLAAPAAAWLVITLQNLAISATRSAFATDTLSSSGYLALTLGFAMLYGAPISYAASALFGLPIVNALARTGRLRLHLLLLYGALTGVLAAFLLGLVIGELTSGFRYRLEPAGALYPFFAGAILGTIVAVSYWALGIREPRPGTDR